MKTSEERQKEFRKDLKRLLKKHGAEMEITDDGASYWYHKGIVMIYMPSRYDSDGNLIEENTDFQL